jgi:tetratricopeptide (TPR) repeat protein
MTLENGQADAGGALASAMDLINAGRLADAEAVCRAAVEAVPNDAQGWHLLGGIALHKGDAKSAVEYCRRATVLAPTLAKAYSNLGAALSATGQTGEAIETLETAVRIDPSLASAYINLGDVLMKEERFAEAVTFLERAISLNPASTLAQINLAAALTRQDRVAEAIAILNKVTEQNPQLAQAHNNLGYALHKNRDYEKAWQALRRAQELRPDLLDVYVNLGLVCRVLGRFDEAVAAYTKALDLRRDFPDAAFFRSLILLTQGHFAMGWQDYLHRFSARKKNLPFHHQPLEADLTGVRILLRRDQGLGDEIFFLRFAPELKRRGAHVTYQAHGKIASLFARLPFLDSVIDDGSEPGPYDRIVSIGDLPYLLGMSSADGIPPSLELPVVPDRLVAQKAALTAFGPPPYIGVTWRAGTDQLGNLFKAISLQDIGSVLRSKAATLIALQRLPELGEIQALSRSTGRTVHDLTAVNDQLEDMLAVVSLLDDYVTVSNTNVHLRAATGKGSRVLVPWPPEFRWMAEGRASPWFPGSTVYRQDQGGSWDAALTALAADLV